MVSAATAGGSLSTQRAEPPTGGVLERHWIQCAIWRDLVWMLDLHMSGPVPSPVCTCGLKLACCTCDHGKNLTEAMAIPRTENCRDGHDFISLCTPTIGYHGVCRRCGLDYWM